MALLNFGDLLINRNNFNTVKYFVHSPNSPTPSNSKSKSTALQAQYLPRRGTQCAKLIIYNIRVIANAPQLL